MLTCLVYLSTLVFVFLSDSLEVAGLCFASDCSAVQDGSGWALDLLVSRRPCALFLQSGGALVGHILRAGPHLVQVLHTMTVLDQHTITKPYSKVTFLTTYHYKGFFKNCIKDLKPNNITFSSFVVFYFSQCCNILNVDSHWCTPAFISWSQQKNIFPLKL